MATRKRAAVVVDPVTEVVADLVTNPLTGAPVRSRSNCYDSRYCEMILKFFADMLEMSGAKLADTEVQETREIAERQPPPKPEDLPPVEEGKPALGRTPGRPGMVIQETRKVKRKEWRLVCAELPSFAKFGRVIGVSSYVIKGWRLQYPNFNEACEMALDMAGDALLQRGLRGQYDAEMVKFVGGTWYGFSSKLEVTGKDGAPLNPPAEYRLVPAEMIDEQLKLLREMRAKLLTGGTTTA